MSAEEAPDAAPMSTPEPTPQILVVSDSNEALVDQGDAPQPLSSEAPAAESEGELPATAAEEDPAQGPPEVRVSVSHEENEAAFGAEELGEDDGLRGGQLSVAPSPYHGTGDTPIGGRAFDPSLLEDEPPVAINLEFTAAVEELPEPVQAPQVHPESARSGSLSDVGEEPSQAVAYAASVPVVVVSAEESARRTALIEAILAAQHEKRLFEARIAAAQSSVAEMLKKKQKDDKREERDRGIENHGERYVKYLATMSEMVKEAHWLAAAHKDQTDRMRETLMAEQTLVSAYTAEFEALKLATARGAVSQRTGRPLPLPQIKEMLAAEAAKEAAVSQARLTHLRLQHSLRTTEETLREGEQLGEGLHLIDFEQLKLENQTFNEKIEERNEDVIKLRTKIANTVNILSHVKEVLQDTEEENLELQAKLRAIESQAAQQRDVLSRMKRARDKLKDDNTRLRQQAGLAGDEVLLRDMEATVDRAADLRARVEDLRAQHDSLQQQIRAAQATRQPSRVTAGSTALFS